jgi:hypothetical protein
MSQQYFVFTPNPEGSQMKTMSYCIDYMNNGARWTATFTNGTFYHYRNGDKNQMHTDDHLDYDTPGGALLRLEIRGDKMYTGKPGSQLSAGPIEYKGWDGATWKADLVRMIDFHPDLKQ